MEKIRMVGYDSVHTDDFVYDVPKDHGYYLLILTQTPARFRLEDEEKVLPPGQAALFAPHSRILYGAEGVPYSDDWVIFTSDEAYVTQFPAVGRPFPVLDQEYCHSLFQLLTWEHSGKNFEHVTSQLLSILFGKLETEIQNTPEIGYRRELLTLRKNIMNQPQKAWNIAEMAEDLHISEGYLQLLYKKQFGISCMDDVINGRLRLARDYLIHTGISISEIASLCGYNSAEHFSRQFRKRAGEAPGSFRRSWSENKSDI